jgi:hypothetical protein
MDRIHRWTEQITTGVIAGLITAAVIAVLVVLFAAFKSTGGAVLIVVFLGTFASGLVILEHLGSLLRRKEEPTPLPPPTPKEWAKTLYDWLIQNDYRVKKMAIQEHMLFGIEVTYQNNQFAHLVMFDDNPKLLFIITGVDVTDDQQKALESYSDSEQIKIYNDVHIELLKFGIEIPKFTKSEIRLQDTLLCGDQLDEYYLSQRLFFVQRAMNLAIMLLATALSSAPKAR